MRVLLAGTPVRSPAGVSHPGPHLGEVTVAPGKGAGEVLELPDLCYPLYVALLLKGQPSRIVTTILEMPETLHEHLDTTLFTGVTNYAAHGLTSLFIRRWDQGGQSKETEPLALSPGPNGALSPASPPGFVTALTTARSR
ncbi:MAG: hypothetical protein K0Q96_462, partial [Rubrobacteraceae bacterium]|nr:hypothetical protein [Rubrobacteraceae bacterium]